MNISLPDHVHRKMKEVCDRNKQVLGENINWSQVAQQAFIDRIREAEKDMEIHFELKQRAKEVAGEMKRQHGKNSMFLSFLGKELTS